MKKNTTLKVIVLLATYNGAEWLSEQLDSILNQRDVNVKLIVSDDMSTDGTIELLEKYAKKDHRITLLPNKGKFGSAAKNFYRLIVDADISDCNFVALADQDDIWLKNKLSALSKIANHNGCDGISSNVVAFWEDGSRALIDKSKPLRQLDFLFESAGPGCTYLMTSKLVKVVRVMLSENYAEINQVKAHDWLIYAICRASGKKWFISSVPTVKYRQHDHNELGVNLGIKANWFRLMRLRSGWYKSEVFKVCKVCKQLTSDMFIKNACDVIINSQGLSRFKLLKFISHYRRTIEDRVVLRVTIILNIF